MNAQWLLKMSISILRPGKRTADILSASEPSTVRLFLNCFYFCFEGKNKDINRDRYPDLAVGTPSRNAGAGGNQGVVTHLIRLITGNASSRPIWKSLPMNYFRIFFICFGFIFIIIVIPPTRHSLTWRSSYSQAERDRDGGASVFLRMQKMDESREPGRRA